MYSLLLEFDWPWAQSGMRFCYCCMSVIAISSVLGMDHPRWCRGVAGGNPGNPENPESRDTCINMPISTHSSVTNLLHSSAYRSAPTQTPTLRYILGAINLNISRAKSLPLNRLQRPTLRKGIYYGGVCVVASARH